MQAHCSTNKQRLIERLFSIYKLNYREVLFSISLKYNKRDKKTIWTLNKSELKMSVLSYLLVLVE